MDLLLDALSDSLVDTAKLVPFLFVTYLAMEALEHGTTGLSERVVRDAGKAGPAVGALLGAIPQCGFSAMAATLYSARVVTAGTLVAVVLSTSDEMLPVFLAEQASLATVGSIMLSKVVIGLAVGLALDAALCRLHRSGDGRAHIGELCERDHCDCECDAHGDAAHGASGTALVIARSALVHTVKVGLFILALSFVMALVISLVGEDAFAAFVGSHPTRAVFLSALVGLIPNCGASVIITELYLGGSLGAGAMLAGLLVSGGVGMLVLYRTNADLRQNVAITAFVYACGAAAGLVVNGLGVAF